MSDVDTPRALLVMAVQDLYDGESAMVERLDHIRTCLADEAMRDLVEQDTARSGTQREALADIARALDAAPDKAENVWLRAILDDADNDCTSIVQGPLRDIALAGALRKGKQSQRVSYETALALACRLDLAEAAEALGAMIDAAQETDTALARALTRLSGGL